MRAEEVRLQANRSLCIAPFEAGGQWAEDALAAGSWDDNQLSGQLEGVLEGDVPREKAVLATLHSFLSEGFGVVDGSLG